jgi:hypothetical protein
MYLSREVHRLVLNLVLAEIQRIQFAEFVILKDSGFLI